MFLDKLKDGFYKGKLAFELRLLIEQTLFLKMFPSWLNGCKIAGVWGRQPPAKICVFRQDRRRIDNENVCLCEVFSS